MKHKKNVFSWCRGVFRGRWANLTAAQADHHPRVPTQLPPLRASCVLGWPMPPAPQFPPPRTWSCLCSQRSRGPWGIRLMSPWALLSLPTYTFCKAIHSMIPVTTLQPPSREHWLGDWLGVGGWESWGQGVASKERIIMPQQIGWSSGRTCRCLLPSPSVPFS